MDTAILSSSAAPPPRWLGVAWASGAGYVMGVVALAHVLGDGFLGSEPFLMVLFLGVVPGLLSGVAALLGAQGKSALTGFYLTMAGSLSASLVCAPLTWCMYMLTDHAFAPGSGDFGEGLGLLMMVTIIGAFIGAPLGVLFGLPFSAGISSLTALRRRASRASLDAALVVLGLGWVLIGTVVATFVATTQLGTIFDAGMAVTDSELIWVSGSLAAVGLGAALTGGGRWLARSWLAGQIRGGALPGWTILPIDETEHAELLPRLLPFGPTDGVLVHREVTSEGPYRSGEPSSAIALVAI